MMEGQCAGHPLPAVLHTSFAGDATRRFILGFANPNHSKILKMGLDAIIRTTGHRDFYMIFIGKNSTFDLSH
jgi:hypothetical protein